MRLAVIADTHMPRGDRRLPHRCLAELDAADLILHAGDFSEPEVLAAIAEHGRVVAVHGNVDSAELRRELPESVSLDAGGATIAMVHDAGPAKGRLARMRARFPDADAVVFGHSHMPLHEEREGFQIFNPGSPTERRRAPSRSMGIATVEDRAIGFRHIDLESG
jgi:putative phosphoesterase